MNVSKGDMVVFKGYADTPEEGTAILEEGESYEVVEVNAKEKAVVVRVPNPDFNPKKKETEANPSNILLDIFEEEFTAPAKAAAKGKAPAKAVAKAPAKAAKKVEAEDEPADEGNEEPAEEAPPVKVKGKAPVKTAKAAPAKTSAKGKAPVKGKAKLKEPEPEPVNEDPYADLDEESEDAEILGMVNDAEDILDLAKEVSEEASAIEYKLGGVLFHVRKSKAFEAVDARYAEKGGFGLYVLEQLNVEYRKAMYLVDIYYKWNKFGLDATKVAAIGWAKASKIAAVMTEDTAEELLELAENHTVAELVENIKTNYKEVGGVKGDKKVVKLFKFKLFEDQAAAVEEVLNAVASAMEFKTLDMAFEHIIMEWATEHPVSAPAPKAKVKAKAAPTKAKA